jgi:predicted MPP superfamily phosphohydrolase
VEIIGVAGVDRLDLDMPFLRGLGPKAENSVRISLSHFPDILRKTQFLQSDLFLCGHTHGGQICLPGGIPLLRHDSLPRRFCTGIHHVMGAWLIANRGLGYSSRLQLRLFCPAEVIEIRLRPAQQPQRGDGM